MVTSYYWKVATIYADLIAICNYYGNDLYIVQYYYPQKEAEYIALPGAAQEAVLLNQLNQDLTGISEPVVIYEDNQSAIGITKTPQCHERVKHINIKYHFI